MRYIQSFSRACILCVMLPILMGCSSESRRVCEHVRTLTEASTQRDVRNKDYARCVKEARASLREDADAFRNSAACLLSAKSLEDASSCAL